MILAGETVLELIEYTIFLFLRIKEMPPEVALTAPAACYNAGSLEGRPGIFYINTNEFEKK